MSWKAGDLCSSAQNLYTEYKILEINGNRVKIKAVRMQNGNDWNGCGPYEYECDLSSLVPSHATPPKLNVCQEADQIAGQGGERMRDYGHPLDNHQRIADGWSVLLGKPITASSKLPLPVA